MDFNKIFEYSAAVRKYFKAIWQLKENEKLVCQFENRKSYDMFNIPRELSRITKFTIDQGAAVS